MNEWGAKEIIIVSITQQLVKGRTLLRQNGKRGVRVDPSDRIGYMYPVAVRNKELRRLEEKWINRS